MPKRAHFKLQASGVLVGNSLDSGRTQSHHEEPSHVPSDSEPVMPMHCYMAQYSNPQLYSEAMVNTLWHASM
jgi:hypothetical protein